MKQKTVSTYIAAAPKDTRKRLRDIRATILKAAPGASEALKWGMPGYSYRRILVTFAVFKNHIGFYPTPQAVKHFSKQLSKYKTATGSIQFPHNKPLPLGLIRKITLYRVQESVLRDEKWKS